MIHRAIYPYQLLFVNPLLLSVGAYPFLKNIFSRAFFQNRKSLKSEFAAERFSSAYIRTAGGLIPFKIDSPKEKFRFPVGAGALRSVIATIVYLLIDLGVCSSKTTVGAARFERAVQIYVGARGFEPPTSWSRTKRSTELSYAPMKSD